MTTLRILLLICILTPLFALAARIEIQNNAHRIYWDADGESVYLIESSTNLQDWRATGPIYRGDDTERMHEQPLPLNDTIFYRLLAIPADNLKTVATDGQTPEYLGWVTELPTADCASISTRAFPAISSMCITASTAAASSTCAWSETGRASITSRPTHSTPTTW